MTINKVWGEKMIEKIFFNLIAFTLFILIFFKLIRKNDTNYVYLLAIQFIGIAINFVELIIGIKLNLFLKILIYIFSVIAPIIVLIIEHIKKISFSEMLITCFVPILDIMNKNDVMKKYLKTIIEKYPQSLVAHIKLAKIYENEGKKELALEEYEKIVELGNHEQEIYINLGRLYGQCNRSQEAKKIFNNILKQHPDCYKASIELANILYNENEFKEAIQVYMAALKYRPADYDLYYNLGMTYTMLNDFQKAKENYEKAAQINSNLNKATYSLGQLALIYGDLEEARKYFEECINSEEVEAGAYFYLARIAIIKGELDKAINYITIAIEEDSQIYEKMQNDNIFVVIKDKIKKPDLKGKNNTNKKISKKELGVEKHLENTCKLVGKLNNNDIQMIENVMKAKEKEVDEKQIEKEE